MYECYECGTDRGGSGMREDGNCIYCGPVTKTKLKHRVEELRAERDRLVTENAELREERDAAVEFAHAAEQEFCNAHATLDRLREVVPEVLPPHMSWRDALDGARAILYPKETDNE